MAKKNAKDVGRTEPEVDLTPDGEDVLTTNYTSKTNPEGVASSGEDGNEDGGEEKTPAERGTGTNSADRNGASPLGLLFDGSDLEVQSMAKMEFPSRSVDALDLKVPFMPSERQEEYISLNVDMKLTMRQARTLRGLFNGLNTMHMQMADGKHVDKPNDAFKWILDQLADLFTSEVNGKTVA